MNRNRFRLAMDQLRPAQWERFEELASEFLVDEYPGLRTTARASGDRGRDAKVVCPQGEDDVVIQYSIRSDWSSKLTSSVRDVKKNFPDAGVLVFVTNQVIGAAADKQVKKIRRDHKIFVDVRDQSWFLERLNTTVSRELAAEALAVEIVEPFLARQGVLERKSEALSDLEARAACVHLSLQWEDDTREKGLTRLSFEALVRSALRDTDPDHRMSRQAIQAHVRGVLPTQPAELVDRYTDAAPIQLTKRHIRHYREADEFCLTRDERIRIAGRLADVEQGDRDLQVYLAELVDRARQQVPSLDIEPSELVHATKRVLDLTLWRRGETFAAAVSQGAVDLDFPEVRDVASEVARELWPARKADDRITQVLVAATQDALTIPTASVHRYLRSLADSYTLLAFLRETADVQAAVVKMFSAGDLWLDTTVVLPLFAEELTEDHGARLYTSRLPGSS